MKKHLALSITLCVLLTLTSCRYRLHERPLIPGIRPSQDVETTATIDEPETQSVEQETQDDVWQQENESNNIFEEETEETEQDAEALESSDENPTPQMIMPERLNDRPEQILRRAGYVTSYNKETRAPNWTAWRLFGNHTNGQWKRKGVKYHEDEDVGYPKATNSDFYGSGYDRGHMCPSGDNKWDRQAQEDCFLFTNMCLQNHALNGGDWNDLEIKCRKWAEKYGDILIVCGPIFSEKPYKTKGKNKVAIPDAFFKVVVCLNGTPKGIGFYYPNEDGHQSMSSYATSIDEIEDITGIDFFASLPDNIEKNVEKQCNFNDWR